MNGSLLKIKFSDDLETAKWFTKKENDMKETCESPRNKVEQQLTSKDSQDCSKLFDSDVGTTQGPVLYANIITELQVFTSILLCNDARTKINNLNLRLQ